MAHKSTGTRLSGWAGAVQIERALLAPTASPNRERVIPDIH